MRTLILSLGLACAAAATAATPSGIHDFDFLVGDWTVQHRKLKTRFTHNDAWITFDGTISVRKVLDGAGNVGDNLFRYPDGDARGASLRAYDPATGLWSSWWLDGRSPTGKLDPPIRGRFENGVGTFTADDTYEGRPIKVKTTWSRITPTSARWEQAWSPDGGKSWELNWTSDFQRVR
jgi:hypothetical protein